MKKWLVALVVVMFLTTILLSAETAAAPATVERVIVRVSPSANYALVKAQVLDASRRLGGALVSEIPEIRAVVLAGQVAQRRL
jgi:hypothetical protein